MTARLLVLLDQLEPALVRQVFTHSSWVADRSRSYERLEFLGDSVLSLSITTELYRRYSQFSEGHLARLRAYVVSRETCAKVAHALGLSKLLRRYAGENHENGELEQLSANANVLADLTEALIGAVYLTFGLDTVRPAVIEVFAEHIRFAEKSYVDYKTELQELLARSARSVVLPAGRRERAGARPALQGRGGRRRRDAGPRRRPEQEARRAAGGRRGAGARCRRGRADRARVRPRMGRRKAAEASSNVQRQVAAAQPTSLGVPAVHPPAGLQVVRQEDELLFEPGVAVVIGPNGSGKSNLAEAVMWALGEQSPTSMRGTSMQDVIFAGSDGRRAGGGAEVELTFENSDGALPLPTAEVERDASRTARRAVGVQGQPRGLPPQRRRRAHERRRAGQGAALHNRAGPRGVVPGQQAVGPAGAGRRSGRAGTLQAPPRAGALKLRETQRNLERALDMERDVGSLLVPLRRQATAAEQLRAAERERDEVRGRVLAGELGELDARLSALTTGAGRAGGRARGHGGRARWGWPSSGPAKKTTTSARCANGSVAHSAPCACARWASRIEGCARLTEQRALLFDEVERAGRAERTGCWPSSRYRRRRPTMHGRPSGSGCRRRSSRPRPRTRPPPSGWAPPAARWPSAAPRPPGWRPSARPRRCAPRAWPSAGRRCRPI